MYPILLVLHSLFRWMVVGSLVAAILRAWKGYRSNLPFKTLDNNIRHWTATIAHVQLVLGIILYTQSPLIKFFWKDTRAAGMYQDTFFFGVLHALGMLTVIVVITVGSSLAKRRVEDGARFKTMFLWFLAAFIIVLICIPWPFSPFSQRPLLR